MSNFNVSTPSDSDFRSNGYAVINELKSSILDALRCGEVEGVESIFPGVSPSTTPVFHYRGRKGETGGRPTSGQYGLFFDTSRSSLQRDNGSSWDDITTCIPTGTKAVFFQSSAPIGWTQDTTNTDKALRVVSSDGGGTGGEDGLSSPPSTAHVHSTDAHILTIDEIPEHTHDVAIEIRLGGAPGTAPIGDLTADSIGYTGGGQSHTHGNTLTKSPTAFSPQYIDVIVCSKN